MAFESKSISVAPSEEQNTIELFQTFGWELKSSQEVFSQESHLERDGDDIRSVTSTTNYVKLTFSRDKEMENYAKLAQLENQFYSISNPVKQSAKVIFGLGAAALLAGAALESEIGIAGFIAGGVIAIVCFVFGFKKSSKNKAEYNAAMNAAIAKRSAILEEASKYN